MTSARTRAALALAAVSFAAGCNKAPVPAVEYGEELFGRADLSPSSFNVFSCATCHTTTEEPPDGVIAPGGSLRNVAFRGTWWNGYEGTLLDAVNFCLFWFMRGDMITRDDPQGRALYEYLASISPMRPAASIPFTVVLDVSEAPERGDPARGADVYDGACKVCHGKWPSGRGRLRPLVPRITDEMASYPEIFPGIDPALVVTEKVRHGQFFGVGGNMPFYSLEVMSDEDLGALLAYMGL
jgi:thiosulfate dehydrogenase